ncbi:MAG: hypothetical protein HQL01_12370 [Nitrospirae bacterium]|nr:hypothetical protein [Nitrospirota bacterium]
MIDIANISPIKMGFTPEIRYREENWGENHIEISVSDAIATHLRGEIKREAKQYFTTLLDSCFRRNDKLAVENSLSVIPAKAGIQFLISI